MAGYNDAFAACYDGLIAGVDYNSRADFYLSVCKRMGGRCELVLDLACGTGSLALALAQRGYEVIGVDGSPDMLMQAQDKCQGVTPRVLYLCQALEELDLYGTVDLAICMQDSLNHLEGADALQQAFQRLQYFVEPGGLFIFDMNTPYKHQQVLGNNVFVYETQALYCAWQNFYLPDSQAVDVQLDFFHRQKDGSYRRSSEAFREYSYPSAQVEAMLQKANFTLLELQGDYTGAPPAAEEERLVYIAMRNQ